MSPKWSQLWLCEHTLKVGISLVPNKTGCVAHHWARLFCLVGCILRSWMHPTILFCNLKMLGFFMAFKHYNWIYLNTWCVKIYSIIMLIQNKSMTTLTLMSKIGLFNKHLAVRVSCRASMKLECFWSSHRTVMNQNPVLHKTIGKRCAAGTASECWEIKQCASWLKAS